MQKKKPLVALIPDKGVLDLSKSLCVFYNKTLLLWVKRHYSTGPFYVFLFKQSIFIIHLFGKSTRMGSVLSKINFF